MSEPCCRRPLSCSSMQLSTGMPSFCAEKKTFMKLMYWAAVSPVLDTTSSRGHSFSVSFLAACTLVMEQN